LGESGLAWRIERVLSEHQKPILLPLPSRTIDAGDLLIVITAWRLPHDPLTAVGLRVVVVSM